MQAPQRERVSISTRVRRPSSAAGRPGGRKSPGKQRGWRDHIDPSVNMGVPTLMMILEPNVVWGHSHVSKRVLCLAQCSMQNSTQVPNDIRHTSLQHIVLLETMTSHVSCCQQAPSTQNAMQT
eukprot:GHUV01051001.1.p2 GENE.GHUV01051001.1~~GHUV01051001.1.p2  ORF type:complete len:123 (-),score=23.10 GHUV01051001.1:99-467(-)